MMFQRCTSNSDCWETDSECRDQTCGCLMGLSYQPGEDACVDSLVGGKYTRRQTLSAVIKLVAVLWD